MSRPGGESMQRVIALGTRAFAESRIRLLAFALFFCGYAAVNASAYESAYPTRADRVTFATNFGDNAAVKLFYGTPHDLLTSGGYTAWRVGGILSIFAAAWAMLACVRPLRGGEDSGNQEIVLSARVGRGEHFAAVLGALAAGALGLWLAVTAGLCAGGLPLGGSAYEGLAILSVVPVFAGFGALASQLAGTRRVATGLSFGVLAAAFLLRAISDTASGAGWLRWTTPLGWVEEMRAFTGARPLVVILPLLAGVALCWASLWLYRRRDIGSGMLRTRDAVAPRMALLSSPAAQALRGERGSLVAWVGGAGALAFTVGVISDSVDSSSLPASVQQQVEKYGLSSIGAPSDYIGFAFLFIVLAISLFACSQVTATRHEEASQRLDSLLAAPVSRRSWLAGRAILALLGSAAIACRPGSSPGPAPQPRAPVCPSATCSERD